MNFYIKPNIYFIVISDNSSKDIVVQKSVNHLLIVPFFHIKFCSINILPNCKLHLLCGQIYHPVIKCDLTLCNFTFPYFIKKYLKNKIENKDYSIHLK